MHDIFISFSQDASVGLTVVKEMSRQEIEE